MTDRALSPDRPTFSPFEPLFVAVEELPPAFREQFLHGPDDDWGIELRGTVHRVWFRPGWLAPLFFLLEQLGILISQRGSELPLTLAVVPQVDSYRRPFHIWARSFFFHGRRRFFDTVVVYQRSSGRLCDLVGPRNAVMVEWDAAFVSPDTLTLNTARCGFRVGERLCWLPNWFWPWVFGRVRFSQRAELSSDDTVHTSMTIHHPLLGDIYGYDCTLRVQRTNENAGEQWQME